MHELEIEVADDELAWLVANVDRLKEQALAEYCGPDDMMVARLARAAVEHDRQYNCQAGGDITPPRTVGDLKAMEGIQIRSGDIGTLGDLGRVLSRAFRGPRISWREVDAFHWEGVCDGHQFKVEGGDAVYEWHHFGPDGDVTPVGTGRTMVLEKAMDDALGSFKRWEAAQRDEAAKLADTLAGIGVDLDPAVIDFGDAGQARIVGMSDDGAVVAFEGAPSMDLDRLGRAIAERLGSVDDALRAREAAADAHTAEAQATGQYETERAEAARQLDQAEAAGDDEAMPSLSDLFGQATEGIYIHLGDGFAELGDEPYRQAGGEGDPI